MSVAEKTEKSIQLIKQYEQEAIKTNREYTVCFSGGKDSQVLLDLFKRSGVKYHAIYNVTTNDPPENVYFIKKHYPDVEFLHPKLTYLELIEKNRMLPTINKRFCCAKLKEYSGQGFVATGVRKEESSKRAEYAAIETDKRQPYIIGGCGLKKFKKVHFRPILEWTEQDIWEYIEDRNIPTNPCYESSGRVGCIFCQFKTKKEMIYNSKQYPRYFRLLMRTIQRIIDNGYMRDFSPVTAEQVWEWWISNETAAKFFTQTKLDL